MKIPVLIAAFCLGLSVTPATLAKPDKDHKGKKHIPKGLQKKMAKGKELPPGWKKKLRVGDRLSDDVYRHRHVIAPVDIHGHITIRVDDTILKMHEKTRKIIKILTND